MPAPGGPVSHPDLIPPQAVEVIMAKPKRISFDNLRPLMAQAHRIIQKFST